MTDLPDALVRQSAPVARVDRIVGTLVLSSPVTVDDGIGHRIVAQWKTTDTIAVGASVVAVNVNGAWVVLGAVQRV